MLTTRRIFLNDYTNDKLKIFAIINGETCTISITNNTSKDIIVFALGFFTRQNIISSRKELTPNTFKYEHIDVHPTEELPVYITRYNKYSFNMQLLNVAFPLNGIYLDISEEMFPYLSSETFAVKYTYELFGRRIQKMSNKVNRIFKVYQDLKFIH